MICAGEMFAIASKAYDEKIEVERLAEIKRIHDITNNTLAITLPAIEEELLKKAKSGVKPETLVLEYPYFESYYTSNKEHDIFYIAKHDTYADGTPCLFKTTKEFHLPTLIHALEENCYQVEQITIKAVHWGDGKNNKWTTPCLRIKLDPKCFT